MPFSLKISSKSGRIPKLSFASVDPKFSCEFFFNETRSGLGEHAGERAGAGAGEAGGGIGDCAVQARHVQARNKAGHVLEPCEMD